MSFSRDQAIHKERHIRIICIGAGASGLLFAYKLQRSFQNFELTVYEKNPEVSGTWYENKYPGCACDNPAHNYTYSFEPKTDWSSLYAGSGEIKQYFQDFTTRYSLAKYIELEHAVSRARWDENLGRWAVEVQNLRTGHILEKECDILINAGGYLNHWKWPEIRGLRTYKGPLIHSANWDENVQLAGKTVGLIGNGSSGIQILAAIQPVVGHLTTFIRSPTYVWGRPAPAYSAEQIEDFSKKPETLLALRRANEVHSNSVFSVYVRDAPLQVEGKAKIRGHMKQALQDEYLEKKLIPSWDIGCRRLSPSPEYLAKLRKENVKLVFSSVVELTETGCMCSDGNEYPVDVVICATGFSGSFKPRFPIVGPSGLNLQDTWDLGPQSYLGIAVSAMPNYMTFLGPNSPVVNGPLIPAIEAQASYILSFIDRYQTESIHSFAPKPTAVADFAAHVKATIQSTVWASGCSAWFSDPSLLWPGSSLHYMEAVREPRADDWDITYRGNRFSYLGNGFSQTEWDPSSDLAFYIRDEEGAGLDGGWDSRRRRREVLTRSGGPLRELHRLTIPG